MTEDERAILKAVGEIAMMVGREHMRRLDEQLHSPLLTNAERDRVMWDHRDLHRSMEAIKQAAMRMNASHAR